MIPKAGILEHKDVVHCCLIEGHRDNQYFQRVPRVVGSRDGPWCMNLGPELIINSWRHEVARRWAPDLKASHPRVAIGRILRRDGGRGGEHGPDHGSNARFNQINWPRTKTSSTTPTSNQ